MLFQKTLRIFSLIVFIFLCINFSSVLRAEDNNANAADLYVKAQSLATYLPQDFIEKTNKVINDGWAENNEELKEILIKNQETINEFKKATKLIHCDFSFGKPIVKNFTAPTPAHFKYLVTLARLVILEG